MEFCLCSKYGMLQSKTPLQGGPGMLPQKNLKFETLIGDLQHAVFGEQVLPGAFLYLVIFGLPVCGGFFLTMS